MVETDGRAVAGGLAVLSLLLLAGCLQIGVHSTVAGDGTISEYRMQINVSRTAYGFLTQSAKDQGYDSVKAYLLADVRGGQSPDNETLLAGVNRSDVGNVSYRETFHGDRVSMEITMEDVRPPAGGALSVTERDGTLVYEDRTFVNESSANATTGELDRQVAAGFAVDYYLTMPGKITDTNADVVDGNTAEWHATGADAFTNTSIHAESEKPASAPLDGFGVVVALVALLVAPVVIRRRR